MRRLASRWAPRFPYGWRCLQPCVRTKRLCRLQCMRQIDLEMIPRASKIHAQFQPTGTGGSGSSTENDRRESVCLWVVRSLHPKAADCRWTTTQCVRSQQMRRPKVARYVRQAWRAVPRFRRPIAGEYRHCTNRKECRLSTPMGRIDQIAATADGSSGSAVSADCGPAAWRAMCGATCWAMRHQLPSVGSSMTW